jgi:hypothetical protein
MCNSTEAVEGLDCAGCDLTLTRRDLMRLNIEQIVETATRINYDK